MPLEIEKSTNFGVTANYWRVDEVSLSLRSGQLCVTVNGYPSEQASQSGAAPIGSECVSLTIGATQTRDGAQPVPHLPTETAQSLVASVEAALKSSQAFAGARDA